MAARTNLVKAPPTDTTVLGRNYLMATDEAIQTAIKNLQFELDLRAKRAGISQAVKDQSTERLLELRAEIDAIGDVYDYEKDGGL